MTLVSIIIATFNSSHTLPKVLEAINKQTYPKKNLEILIVDGGSTDDTIKIGKKFGCKIINNPRVEPVYAKYLGYKQASGRYIMYIDHDEVMTNMKSIANKINLLRTNPKVKAITGDGYITPNGYQAINRYINEFGDPFSFFYYHLSKNPDYFLSSMKKKYVIIKDTPLYSIFDLSSSSQIPIIELVAGGGMIDGMFFKKTFPDLTKQYHLVPHLLHLLRVNYPTIAITKNDPLLHFSSDRFQSYVQKIIWRVKNNIFFSNAVGVAGFSGRAQFQSQISTFKKFLFLPYAFSILFPLIDTMYLMYTRKDMSYWIHLPLSIMTAILIIYFYLLKIFGIIPTFTSYDGSTKAYEK